MTHIKWSKIGRLKHLVADLTRKAEYSGEVAAPMSFRGKVKLHGTNAGIRIEADGRVVPQSRNNDLSLASTNAGFGEWVLQHEDYWRQFGNIDGPVVIFGEWAGPGIMKGCAVHKAPYKFFAIFAIVIYRPFGEVVDGEQLVHIERIDDPADIMAWLQERERRTLERGAFWTCVTPLYYILPWYTPELQVDLLDPEDRVKFAGLVEDLVSMVEEEDPWVKETFGVSGVGEGIVFYETNSHLMFKAKGTMHEKGDGTRTPKVPIAPEVLASIQAFAEYFVTDARCEQALAEACDGDASPENTGKYLKWVGQDIKAESALELEANHLLWKDVAKAVINQAKVWYLAKQREV